MRRRRLDQFADNFVPAFSTEKRHFRIVCNLAGKRRPITVRYVGKISDNYVICLIHVCQQIAAQEFDPTR